MVNRREFLKGIAATYLNASFPINNIPDNIINTLDFFHFPTKIIWVDDETFKNWMKKAEIDDSITEKFLSKKRNLIQKTNIIWQKLLNDLQEKDNSKYIKIFSQQPHINMNKPKETNGRWWWERMTWDDFFSLENPYNIYWEYIIEDNIELHCSEQFIEAQWMIYIHFFPNGDYKLNLRLSSQSKQLSSDWDEFSTDCNSLDDIRKQLYEWLSQDWSDYIKLTHRESINKARKLLKEHLKNQYKKTDFLNQKRINIMKNTSALTSPKQTLIHYKNITDRLLVNN